MSFVARLAAIRNELAAMAVTMPSLASIAADLYREEIQLKSKEFSEQQGIVAPAREERPVVQDEMPLNINIGADLQEKEAQVEQRALAEQVPDQQEPQEEQAQEQKKAQQEREQQEQEEAQKERKEQAQDQQDAQKERKEQAQEQEEAQQERASDDKEQTKKGNAIEPNDEQDESDDQVEEEPALQHFKEVAENDAAATEQQKKDEAKVHQKKEKKTLSGRKSRPVIRFGESPKKKSKVEQESNFEKETVEKNPVEKKKFETSKSTSKPRVGFPKDCANGCGKILNNPWIQTRHYKVCPSKDTEKDAAAKSAGDDEQHGFADVPKKQRKGKAPLRNAKKRAHDTIGGATLPENKKGVGASQDAFGFESTVEASRAATLLAENMRCEDDDDATRSDFSEDDESVPRIFIDQETGAKQLESGSLY